MSSESLANVSHLHEWKSNTATYRDFYEIYGTAREGAAILLNRVLHVDESDDHSVHLIVEQGHNSGGYMVPIVSSEYNHAPVYRVGYSPTEVRIATTDGETISTYHTRCVQGIYWGGINKAYDPADEQLQVDFVSLRTKETGLLAFNLATGRGSFALGERALGWILDAQESEELRQLALNPKPNPLSA